VRAVAVAVVTLALAGILSAQQPTFRRTVIRQSDISVPGREVVTAIAEFAPGASVGWHTHPGEEVGYLLEGTLSFEHDGRPPVTLSPGQTFFVPAGGIHNATNTGSRTARVLATYIVEKGKPLAAPAPTR